MTNIITNVTPDLCVNYGALTVAFFDKERELPKGNQVIKEVRLYIAIDIAGQKSNCRRLAEEGETERYRRAYDLYLAAKKNGGKAFNPVDLVDENEKLKQEIAKLQSAKKARIKKKDNVDVIADDMPEHSKE